MARVIIEITDMANGEVHLELTADPPMEEGIAPTLAQEQAVACLKGMLAEVACGQLSKAYKGAEAAGGE